MTALREEVEVYPRALQPREAEEQALRSGYAPLASPTIKGMDNLYPRTRFWFTAAIALAALTVTGWFCAIGHFGALLGWLTGCGLAGILVNLPAIESFALTKDGLSAKMRATLAEAAATIDQLRALATSTARSS